MRLRRGLWTIVSEKWLLMVCLIFFWGRVRIVTEFLNSWKYDKKLGNICTTVFRIDDPTSSVVVAILLKRKWLGIEENSNYSVGLLWERTSYRLTWSPEFSDRMACYLLLTIRFGLSLSVVHLFKMRDENLHLYYLQLGLFPTKLCRSVTSLLTEGNCCLDLIGLFKS